MHRTNTVDYIIVLRGEIHAIMDTGDTLLRPGDVLIQRGTIHSWSVRGTEPCVIAAILVSAAPIGKVGKRAAKRPAKRAAKRAPGKRAKKPARKATQPRSRSARRPRKIARHR